LAFALDNLQQRGTFMSNQVMRSMKARLSATLPKVKICMSIQPKAKQLTNMRASGSDDSVYLAAPFLLSIERAMEIMQDDEYIEITPESVRLRKKYLFSSTEQLFFWFKKHSSLAPKRPLSKMSRPKF
jgi:GTP-binding protein